MFTESAIPLTFPKGTAMHKFTDTEIKSINSALDHIARVPTAIRHTQPLDSTTQQVMARIHISCHYIAPREYNHFGARVSSRMTTPAYYNATCKLGFGLDCTATGHRPIAAYRRLFKALAARAALSDRRIRVPLSLSHPTEARQQARAERKAFAEAEALRKQQAEQAYLDAKAKAAPTTVITAPTSDQ